MVSQVGAVVYAIIMTKSEDLDWQMRAIRVLPMFLLPALSSMMYSILVNFTSMCKYLRTLVRTFHIYQVLAILITNCFFFQICYPQSLSFNAFDDFHLYKVIGIEKRTSRPFQLLSLMISPVGVYVSPCIETHLEAHV